MQFVKNYMESAYKTWKPTYYKCYLLQHKVSLVYISDCIN